MPGVPWDRLRGLPHVRLSRRADARALRAAAVAAGMRTMHADGMSKVAAGITTEAEVMRATRES
jgi:type II secretory ATPase GspE/PulE/Tfp pilus assembly ATPase PilB-like protein